MCFQMFWENGRLIGRLKREGLEKIKVRDAVAIFAHGSGRVDAAFNAELEDRPSDTEGALGVMPVGNVIVTHHYPPRTELGPPVLEVPLDPLVGMVSVNVDKVQGTVREERSGIKRVLSDRFPPPVVRGEDRLHPRDKGLKVCRVTVVDVVVADTVILYGIM